jgi:ElaB/YqjD/DUF883 family membrane-anchored ribosome-binding protein
MKFWRPFPTCPAAPGGANAGRRQLSPHIDAPRDRHLNEIEAAALPLCDSTQEHEIMAQSQYGSRSDLSDKATDLKDQATGQIKKVAGQVEEYASDTMDKLRDTSAGEVAGNLKGAVDKSVKDQPMATLALAAALGFVLGALWKS